MAGHSQFKNVMYRKNTQDTKRARMFTKLAREITIACKNGNYRSGMNPRLRSAIQAARSQNMPKDSIERAIRKASTISNGTDYEEVRYEGYGPGRVAIMIETLTDNRNRTAADIRAIFAKHGGTLGETNSVVFNFKRIGTLRYPIGVALSDVILEAVIEAGADDVKSDEGSHQIYCAPNVLSTVREVLESRFGVLGAACLEWQPLVMVPVINNDTAYDLLQFLDILGNNDDVQNVVANFDMSDVLMEHWIYEKYTT